MAVAIPNIMGGNITILKGRLAKVLPWQGDPLMDHADMLRKGMVEEANARGFVIQSSVGRTHIELPGGLSETHYEYFAPLVTDDEKGLLARGVLEQITQLDWIDWNAGLDILRKQYGVNEEAWLPEMVAISGFEAIAAEMQQRLAAHRKANPRPRLTLELVETPTWNPTTRMLIYGGMRWHFREDAEIIITLLNELQKNKWQAIFFSDPRDQGKSRKLYIEPEQVRSAAKSLRKKTRTRLNWHAADDGTFSWSPR